MKLCVHKRDELPAFLLWLARRERSTCLFRELVVAAARSGPTTEYVRVDIDPNVARLVAVAVEEGVIE